MTTLFFFDRAALLLLPLLLLLLSLSSSSVVRAFTVTTGDVLHPQQPYAPWPSRAADWCPRPTTTTARTVRSSSNHQWTVASTSTTSTSSSSTMMAPPPIIINGINIDITPALDEYVHKRIGKALSKFSGSVITECDVVLSVSKNPKVKSGHRVEIVTDIKGTTIICKNQSPDMYESIDLAAHALQRKLVKYKERRNEGYHGGLAMGEDLRAALESLEAEAAAEDDAAVAASSSKNVVGAAALMDPEDDAFFYEEVASPYKKTVTPVKSFQLDRPISLEEAIFALDYVDHDFYVFRNQDTKEINVVYKRHTGGIGLVAPEEDSSSS